MAALFIFKSQCQLIYYINEKMQSVFKALKS